MKKIVIRCLIVLSCICLIAGCFAASFAETKEVELCALKLNISFDSNVMFSRYNVRLKLDGKQIVLMQHGQGYTGTQDVMPGSHVITFVKEDDDKVTGRAEVYVEGKTTFSCKIHATSGEVEVSELKVTSEGSGQKKNRATPLKVIYFGRYEQDNKTENGEEPIEWYVLEEKDGKALLITKKIIDNEKFNTSSSETMWETSSIRKWLNSTFIETAFTEEEQGAILTSTISNMQADKSGEWSKSEAADTEDKVFLLDYNEYMKYLQLDEEMNPEVTRYANSRGNCYNIWLRSPGKNRKETQFYCLGKTDSNPATDSNAVRPAMWIDFQADRSMFSYERFNAAEELEEKDNYAEAAEVYESLNGYRGSVLRATECRYQQALQTYKSGDIPAAIELLEKIRSYKDSADLILEYKYSIALGYEENGDYNTAVQLFMEIGQYKQTMDHIRTCFDKLHIQYSWLTRKIGDAVNTGMDNGFANKDEIKDGDPHFGWSLGRFMMSGYTELKEEGTRPVFLKTPGDSVTLWFDLAQDIDKLNNDESIRINHDNNGKDVQFQYPKSDFGRGALLIRHIDFRGSDSDVQLYSDYLSAKNGTGANTVVQLNEEGIYEVALDYEIEKKAIIPGYTNYRIYTTFEVRNGSGMFFMFDVSTGAELQDYSRTADGFRIDLANSHSLSISYTRYALNQDETGLDVRKTGPASDGDTFEKVGYYEITVTNKETNEQLTKHIFVGRAADLEEYQAVDDALSKFAK